MRPPEIIETERLILRLPMLSDAETIFRTYAQDVEVVRYVIWKPHSSVEETEAFLRDRIAAWKDHRSFSWVITQKSTDDLIGMVEMRIEDFKANLGYVIARRFWRRGFATEAARSIVNWALNQERIYRVWAVCDVDNAASARVLEKVGMQREGVLRNLLMHPNISSQPRDSYCYSIVKSVG